MTRNDIDELMRDNGIVVVGEAVYALCQLVASAEREACAKICDEFCYGNTKILVEKAFRRRSEIDSIVQNERSARGQQ